VRNTGEIFKLIKNIKNISENINFYTSIYFDAGAGAENIIFSEKYKILIQRADRKIMTDMKNFARP
jgi:hypothetical protein